MHLYRLGADGKLTFVGGNPAADRMLGIISEALVGKTLEEAFPNVVGTEVPARFRAAARDGTGWHAEHVICEAGGLSAFEVTVFQTAPGETPRPPCRPGSAELQTSDCRYWST